MSQVDNPQLSLWLAILHCQGCEYINRMGGGTQGEAILRICVQKWQIMEVK